MFLWSTAAVQFVEPGTGGEFSAARTEEIQNASRSKRGNLLALAVMGFIERQASK
jgi:hypothetical protein